jgi:uncharacterized protein YggE
MDLRCDICNKEATQVKRSTNQVFCSNECAHNHNHEALGELTITGEGKITVMADKVRIPLIVVRKGDKVAPLNAELATANKKIIDLLKELHAEKIATDRISVEPIYNRLVQFDQEGEEQARSIIGYEGELKISFESGIEESGTLIDSVLCSELVSRVEDLDFIVSDAISKAGLIESLRLASLDARTKADTIMEVLGVQFDSIRSVSTNEGSFNPRANYASRKSMANFESSAAPSTQILSPEHEIISEVTLKIAYVQHINNNNDM